MSFLHPRPFTTHESFFRIRVWAICVYINFVQCVVGGSCIDVLNRFNKGYKDNNFIEIIKLNCLSNKLLFNYTTTEPIPCISFATINSWKRGITNLCSNRNRLIKLNRLSLRFLCPSCHIDIPHCKVILSYVPCQPVCTNALISIIVACKAGIPI